MYTNNSAPFSQQYIKFRNEVNAEKGTTSNESTPAFTRSSVVAPADTSFFAKSSAMPFAPKMPSPLGGGEPAVAPSAKQDEGGVDENGDIIETNPEVCCDCRHRYPLGYKKCIPLNGGNC